VEGPRRRQRPHPAHQQRRRGLGAVLVARRHPDRVHPRGGRRHDQHHDPGQRRGRRAGRHPPAGGFDQAPDWSPDGKRIAFNRFLPGEGNRIFTVAPNGKALTQRTFGGPNDVHPAWSPDGTRIAFARGGDQDDGLPFHIHTVTLAGGRTAQVTSGRVQDLLPVWQPL
jgi:WD40-like Beta Propeller Repeat